MLRATEAIAWTSIFPYVYFMIRSFNEVPLSNITFYAGLLIAVFTFAEFLSNMVWSRVSDRMGRKKTLLVGSACGLITALWFGFSRSIASAVASRAFGGLSNPNVGLVQTCAVELTTKDEQRGVFTYISHWYVSATQDADDSLDSVRVVIGDICQIDGVSGHYDCAWRHNNMESANYRNLIGPVIGGILADPATNYPSLFPTNSIWTTYPFLLPNLAVASLQLLTFLLAFFLLEETHPNLTGKPDLGLRVGRAIAVMCTGRRSRTTGSDRTYDYDPLNPDQQQDDIDNPLEPDNQTSHLELQQINTGRSTDSLETTASTTSKDHNNDPNDKTPPIRIFTTQIILQILSVSLLAFHKVSSDAVMPVFLATPPNSPDSNTSHRRQPEQQPQAFIFQTPNGFGYSNQTIGYILLSQAIVAVLTQIRLVPYFIDKMGPLKAYRVVLCIYPILYLSTPFLPAAAALVSLVLVVLELWCKVVLSSVGYICATML